MTTQILEDYHCNSDLREVFALANYALDGSFQMFAFFYPTIVAVRKSMWTHWKMGLA